MDTLFLVALMVEALVGLGLMFVPVSMISPPGAAVNVAALALVRLLGSALISFPVLLWFARKSSDPGFKKGAAYTLFTYYLVSVILLTIIQFTVMMDPLVWIVIAAHLALLVWFGYYLRK